MMTRRHIRFQVEKIDYLLRGAERVCWTKWSVAERGDCKRRGRGLGQRNTGFEKKFAI